MLAISIVQAAVAGAAVFMGLLHLWVGVRSWRSPMRDENLWFSAVCFLTGGLVVPEIYQYISTDAATYAHFTKLSLTPYLLMVGATVWFIASYGNVRPRWFLAAATALTLAATAANLILPYGIAASGLGPFSHFTLPWGEVIAAPQNPPGAWLVALLVLLIAKWIFAVYVTARLVRRGATRQGWIVGGLTSVQTLTLLTDMLVGAGLIGGMYLGEFGCLALITGVSLDLADRAVKSAGVERDLAVSEARMRSMVEHTPSAVFFKDLEGRYELVNRYFLDLVSLDESRVVGHVDNDVFPPEAAARFQDTDRDVLATGRASTYEHQWGTGQDSRWYLSVKFPIPGPDGRPAALCGIATDITALKRAEATLRLSQEILEHRVAERTEDLESFTQAVTHDLRAPLRHTQGFLAALLETHTGELSDEARSLADKAIQSAQHMGTLIEDLATLSRLGLREMRATTVDTRALIVEVWHELVESGEAWRHTLEVGPVPPVVADRGLLRIVWMNLLGNAVKYSAHAQAPLVEVSGGDDATWTWFRVHDNGVGFDDKYAGELFQVFRRLHARSEFPGTGVGLATVKRIVVRHGGSVFAHGTPNQGATFELRLPHDGQNESSLHA